MLLLCCIALITSFVLVYYADFSTTLGTGIPFIGLLAARESLRGYLLQKRVASH